MPRSLKTPGKLALLHSLDLCKSGKMGFGWDQTNRGQPISRNCWILRSMISGATFSSLARQSRQRRFLPSRPKSRREMPISLVVSTAAQCWHNCIRTSQAFMVVSSIQKRSRKSKDFIGMDQLQVKLRHICV